MRHRVVVQVEAHVGRLGCLHGQAFAERILALGQRQQAAAFSLERIAHGEACILGPAPIRRLALAPDARLGVQVVEVGELARGEEGVAPVCFPT